MPDDAVLVRHAPHDSPAVDQRPDLNGFAYADELSFDRGKPRVFAVHGHHLALLLAELERRFEYDLDALARRFDRSVIWVSRRLALVELLAEAIQQQVREGQLAANVAMSIWSR